MDEVGRLLEAFWRGMALHLWQTTLILTPILLLGRSMRRAPARQVHLLWWIALIKLLVPLSMLEPMIGATLGRIVRSWPAEGGVTPVRVVEYVRVALHPTALGGAASMDTFGSTGAVYLLLTLSWSAGMALLVWSWSRRCGPFRREYPHTLETVAPGVRDKLTDAMRGTDIPTSLIRLGPTRRVPAVAGLFRPTILVPERIVAALDAEELRAVLLHEESHRRRRDPALAVVQRCALLLFFFYPPVWWLVRRLVESAEIACDESVLARGVSPAIYGRALSRTLGLNLLPQSLPATIGLGRPAGLRRRLERIEGSWRYRVMPKHRWVLSAALLLVIGPSLAGAISADGSSSKPTGVVATVLNPEGPDRFSDLDRLKAADIPVQLSFTDVPLEEVFRALERTTGVRV
jgi:beta-lactamase regulating signal transducer with metallopeptidase domain